jgi:hypothetical protein
MRQISRIAFTYFPYNAGAGNVTPFPIVDALADGRAEVYGVLAYNNGGFGVLPDGRTTIVPDDTRRVTVTLSNGDAELYVDVPYSDLVRSGPGTGTGPDNGGIWYPLEPFVIDLSKSSVRCVSAAGAGFDVAFAFIYRPTEHAHTV